VNPTKKFVVIMAVALPVVMTATALALTATFGPSDNGLVCTRSESQAGCEVRQSRFFGIAGNSSFVSWSEDRLRNYESGRPRQS
jgi:hypothetical protein